MRPSLGRIVLYRSRTGKYTVPAMITCTQETLVQENVEKGFIEDLSTPTSVHLTVFTPGKPGKRATADDFVGDRKDAPISENTSGTYQEWNVPQVGTPDDLNNQEPGTWCWPARV